MKRALGRRQRGRPPRPFPGKLAGASLKHEMAVPGRRRAGPFPGKLAGASLKPAWVDGTKRLAQVLSPANLPGPH